MPEDNLRSVQEDFVGMVMSCLRYRSSNAVGCDSEVLRM
jgi:hypothetical protein